MSGSSAERGLRGMMRFGSLGIASADATPAPFAARPSAADVSGLGARAAVAPFGCGGAGEDAALRAGISAAVRGLAALGGGAAGLPTLRVAVAGGAGGLAVALEPEGVAGTAGLAAAPDGARAAGAAGLAALGLCGGGADGLAGFGGAHGGSGRKGIAPRSPPFGGFDTVTADNPLLPNA